MCSICLLVRLTGWTHTDFASGAWASRNILLFISASALMSASTAGVTSASQLRVQRGCSSSSSTVSPDFATHWFSEKNGSESDLKTVALTSPQRFHYSFNVCMCRICQRHEETPSPPSRSFSGGKSLYRIY